MTMDHAHHDHGHHAAHDHDVRKHLKAYIMVFGALAILTLVTVKVAGWVETWRLPVAGAIVIALVIASFKGTLVASIFMHLAYDREKPLRWILIITAIFFAALMLLPVLATLDQMEINNL